MICSCGSLMVETVYRKTVAGQKWMRPACRCSICGRVHFLHEWREKRHDG